MAYWLMSNINNYLAKTIIKVTLEENHYMYQLITESISDSNLCDLDRPRYCGLVGRSFLNASANQTIP